MKRSVKKTIGLAFLNLFFISICLAGLIPILYAFLLSVSSGSGALTTGLSLLPEKFTLDNYRSILVGKALPEMAFQFRPPKHGYNGACHGNERHGFLRFFQVPFPRPDGCHAAASSTERLSPDFVHVRYLQTV